MYDSVVFNEHYFASEITPTLNTYKVMEIKDFPMTHIFESHQNLDEKDTANFDIPRHSLF